MISGFIRSHDFKRCLFKKGACKTSSYKINNVSLYFIVRLKQARTPQIISYLSFSTYYPDIIEMVFKCKFLFAAMFTLTMLSSTGFAAKYSSVETIMRLFLEPSRTNATREVKWLNLILHYGYAIFENSAVIYFVVWCLTQESVNRYSNTLFHRCLTSTVS